MHAIAHIAWEFVEEQYNVTKLRAGQKRKQQSASGRGQDFPVIQSLQTGSGVHPAADSVSNICSSPGVKRSEHEANYSFPLGADFKTDRNRNSSATLVFVAFAVTSQSLCILIKQVGTENRTP